ncbi:Selenium-binding protein 2, partial [Habropoda laboriosa]
CTGPGYRSPKVAMHEGPREKLMYVTCIHTDPDKSDVLCTVNVDPSSVDYCKVGVANHTHG